LDERSAVTADPPNIEEYNARQIENAYLSGQGMDVKVHTPCPFCAAGDWHEYRIIDVLAQEGETIFCAECGRTGQFNVWSADGSTHAAISLEAGPDVPDFLKNLFIDNRS
jgi:hypothetical protein